MLKTLLHSINIFGFLWTLCICMFRIDMPRWLIFGGTYIFVATWLIEIIVDKRWQFKPVREWIYYGLLIVFFLWEFLYLPWDGDVYFHHHTEQRYPLLAFGLIGWFGINDRFTRATVIHTMMIASVCSVLFLITKTGWYNAFFSPDRVFLFSECRLQYINSHMEYNFFLNCTLIGIWYLLFHADRKPALWQKIIYPCVAAIIFYALLCSDGRSGFFIGIAMLGGMAVIEIYRYKKALGVGISVVALALLIALSALHPRISLSTIEYDLRYSYWKSAIELIEEKPVFGYGMSRAQEVFDPVNMKYVNEDAKFYWTVINQHYVDCHNQYIQTTLEYGIVGLLLLLAIYLSPLFICWGEERWWLAFFFTLAGMGQSLFDTFLTGQFNTMYGLMFLLTLRMTKDYSSPARPKA